MTDALDYDAILAVIERGIDVARNNKGADEANASDDLTAWCVLQELRRAGWTIHQVSN